MPLKATTNSLF